MRTTRRRCPRHGRPRHATRRRHRRRYGTTLAADHAKPVTAPTLPTVGTVAPNAGLGVEVALAMLNRRPSLITDVLDVEHGTAVLRLLSEIDNRVVGLFDSASSALAAQLAMVRATALTETSIAESTLWHPLVDLVATEATKDEVFAEHLLIRVRETGAASLDSEVLPSENWMTLHTGDLPDIADARPASNEGDHASLLAGSDR